MLLSLDLSKPESAEEGKDKTEEGKEQTEEGKAEGTKEESQSDSSKIEMSLPTSSAAEQAMTSVETPSSIPSLMSVSVASSAEHVSVGEVQPQTADDAASVSFGHNSGGQRPIRPGQRPNMRGQGRGRHDPRPNFRGQRPRYPGPSGASGDPQRYPPPYQQASGLDGAVTEAAKVNILIH